MLREAGKRSQPALLVFLKAIIPQFLGLRCGTRSNICPKPNAKAQWSIRVEVCVVGCTVALLPLRFWSQ
jgi:hypothetical protein